MDTPARPTQPATRLACNRCHQQKLRCHRSPIPGHPCARCENAGVECKFEPPLRPGRPSTRRKSRGKEALSPPKSVPRPYPVTSAAQQEKCMPTSGPSRGYTSELDGVLEEVGSECPLTGSNDDQGNSPFFESNPDEQFFLGCKSPFSDGSLGMATDWPEFSTMPVHSSTPKFHPPSVQHDEIFQHAAANKRENSAPAASTASSVSCTFSPLFSSSSSSSLVSTPSLPPTADVNYCRLLELSTTLHEYCCQLMSVQEAQGESTVISTPTIDQILAVTQSLSEMCSPVSANSGDHNQDTSFQPQSRPSYTHSDADIPSNVPFRSPPDGATVLLILSCYLRLLHLYNAVLSKPSAVGNGNGIQPLCVQIGCFSTAMTSSMSVLACLISQTLGNFEATLKNLVSTVCYPKSPSVGEGDRLWQLDTDKGAESSVSILARAALSEVWTLHTSLRQQLQTMNSVCD